MLILEGDDGRGSLRETKAILADHAIFVRSTR